MKKLIGYLVFIYTFIHKYSKSWIVLTILKNALLAIISITTIIAPKFIIDELLLGAV